MRIHYAVEESPLGTGRRRQERRALPRRAHDRPQRRRPDRRRPRRRSSPSTRRRAPGHPRAHARSRTRRPTASWRPTPTGRVLRFLEKPRARRRSRPTRSTPGSTSSRRGTLDLIPPGVNHSIERGFFPALLAPRRPRARPTSTAATGSTSARRRSTCRSTATSCDGRFPVALEGRTRARGRRPPDGAGRRPRRRPRGALLRRARLPTSTPERASGPDAVLVGDVRVAPGACVRDSVLWAGCRASGRTAEVEGALLGPGVRVGPSARSGRGAVLGEGSLVCDYSRTL